MATIVADCANDLYQRVQAIPSLSASAGLATGGKEGDVGMTRLPLPFAWIVAESGHTTLPANSAVPIAIATAQMNFTVLLHVPYVSQQDLIANQLPLLEQVVSTVHGKTAPTGQRWRFLEYKLGLVNADRMIYRISFLLDAGVF